MPAEEVRFMWLFVFFDLPVGSKVERRNATKFRKFLVDDGFDMMQLSVYTRVCRGQDALEKHVARVQRHLPPKGSVRAIQVTERQYARMHFLVGNKTEKEKSANDQMVLL
jgi:CRISPR-associated protein Cas2